MDICARKQVGPIYYMVKDVDVLASIVAQKVIRTSIKAEPTGNGNGSKHYVSFMRDLTKADRNPGRWVYGVRLDGDKLSDRYKINPYSYAGNTIGTNFFRIKTLTSYDDGTYKLNLVNWPPISIPKSVFDDLEAYVLSQDDSYNANKRLEISEGKVRRQGKKIDIKYNYNVKTGGPSIKEGEVDKSTLAYLLKHTNFNETEERIWILDDNVKYIKINGCITGYIAPKGDRFVQEAIELGELPEMEIVYY